MHILLMAQSLDKGGRTRRLCNLAKQLERRGHSVSICTFEAPLEFIKKQFPILEHVHLLGGRHNKFFMIKQFNSLVAKLAPDIIHANCEESFLVGGVTGRLRGIPVLGTYHRSNLEFYRPCFRYKFFAALMTRCIAISKQRISLMQNQLGIAPDKITLIHGGVDLAAVKDSGDKAAAKAKLGLNPNGHLLLSLGHLGEIKGHDYTLAALVKVISRFPDVHLYIGGDGQPEDYHRLRELIQRYGLEDHVTMLGEVTNAFELMAVCDVFVQPSLEEAFGLVFIEAGAHGKPTVATEVGGIPDIIVDNETGILVPPGDSSALAAAIIKMLENPEWTRELGKNARERIVNNFSIEKMADNYMNVYTTLVR